MTGPDDEGPRFTDEGPPSTDEGPRFTDEEAKEILRRAVDVDRTATLESSEGVSLSELKAIAEEVGIAPSAVDQAARSVRRKSPARKGGFFGGPRSLEAEGYSGAAMDPGDAAELLALVRSGLGTKGQAAEIHGSVEWSGGSELVEEYVTIAPSDGGTKVRAGANLAGLVNLMFGLPLTFGTVLSAVGFVVAADEAAAVGMVLSLLIVPALFLVLRVVYGAVVRSEAAKLDEVVAALVEYQEGTPPADT